MLAFVAGAATGLGVGIVLVLLVYVWREPEVCRTCEGDRVVVYAGDLETDEGYCELRSCPSCSSGDRLGRSDVPIVSEASVALDAVHDRRERLRRIDQGPRRAPPGPPEPPRPPRHRPVS